MRPVPVELAEQLVADHRRQLAVPSARCSAPRRERRRLAVSLTRQLGQVLIAVGQRLAGPEVRPAGKALGGGAWSG